MSNFPGYSWANSIVGAMMDYQQTQAALWNRNWGDIVAGKVGASQLIGLLAQSYEANWQAMDDMVQRYAWGDAPVWANFVHSKANPAVMSQVVAMARGQIEKVAHTPLAQAGGSAVIAADVITATLEANRRSVRVQIDRDKLGSGVATGVYSGFVYDPAATGAPPLVAVTLRVVD